MNCGVWTGGGTIVEHGFVVQIKISSDVLVSIVASQKFIHFI